MIPVSGLVAAFRQIIGWPYRSPGTNDARGIDCSGAFVFAYRRFGQRIYHGSNRIIREYCRDVRDITSLSQLRVGMAIFMARPDLSRMKAEYKPGGRYYNPALPEDYYHIGLVASVTPLEIINATSPRARVDNRLSRWQCAGYLKAVDYGAEAGTADGEPVLNGGGETEPNDSAAPNPSLEAGAGEGSGGGSGEGEAQPDGSATRPDASDAGLPPVPFQAIVTARQGGTVNLRRSPNLRSVVRVRVPLGQTVAVLERTDDQWWRVRYEQTGGYMMREFLEPIVQEA